MRLIHISDYDVKRMTLAKPVLDKKRRTLLAAGRTIDPKIHKKLENMGITYIFVADEISKGIDLNDLIDMPTWSDAVQAIQDFYNGVREKQEPEITVVQKVAKKLLEEVKRRPILLLIPAGTVEKEMQRFAHVVNVAIVALLIGKNLAYNEGKQRDLAVGCLVHDIGKMVTDQYREHPLEGFNYLRHIYQFSLLSAHVAYQHHERIDGTGFPRKLKGETILEVAQICAISNQYDEYISADGLAPHEALEAIMAMTGSSFSIKIVHAFSQSIPVYPPGTEIIVNQRGAIVTKIKRHFQRPVIRFLDNEEEFDLLDHPTYMIKPKKE